MGGGGETWQNVGEKQFNGFFARTHQTLNRSAYQAKKMLSANPIAARHLMACLIEESKYGAPIRQATRFCVRSGFMKCTSSPKLTRTVASAFFHSSVPSLMEKFFSKELGWKVKKKNCNTTNKILQNKNHYIV